MHPPPLEYVDLMKQYISSHWNLVYMSVCRAHGLKYLKAIGFNHINKNKEQMLRVF